MTHTTGSLIAPDGTTLFTQRWEPDGMRAAVALVHGVHEHSGRYAYVASELMRRGVGVYAVDLRGHGRSQGPRGRVEGFDEYLDDLGVHLLDVGRAAGDAPVFLMGHSMGGLVASTYVARRGHAGLDGLILSSPALQLPGETPALLLKLAPVISRWLPNLPVQRVDLSGLSHDPAVARAYRDDPLTTVQGVRARLGYEITRAIDAVRARAAAFDLPLYLFHGTADTVTDPAGTEWLAAHAPSDDVTLRLWDGLYHETLNEVERDQVIEALADWIVARS